MAIRDILLSGGHAFTPSEEKIVRVLLTDYPAAGLGPATALARRAGVSDPTVGRLAVKLGFDGYPAFQHTLLAEVEARLHSPLLMMEAKRPPAEAGTAGAFAAYFASVIDSLEKSVSATPPQSFERAAKLVMDPKRKVSLVGGRFSGFIASMLAAYLGQMRADVRDLGPLSPARFDLLVDIGRADTLIVFDYRRYQADIVSFAEQAASQGARIVLFTDPWCSPVTEVAEVTIMTQVQAASPFDTMAPVMAQAEAFASYLIADLDPAARERIERLEAIRDNNRVTLGGGNRPPRSIGPGGPVDENTQNGE